jgi:hypothetical protein
MSAVLEAELAEIALPLQAGVLYLEHRGTYHRAFLLGDHVRSCHELDLHAELVIGSIENVPPEALCESCFGPRGCTDG